jgi:cyclopropane fatty-acyl-phospholipid synthase-like methyltransferase
MFVYLVHLTNGKSVRVETSGDPTSHPAFFDRVVSVETLGEAGLRLVSDPSDKVYA